MKIIDSCFDIVKNRAQARRLEESAAQPGQMTLTQPSPQTNLRGEKTGETEVSDYIQELQVKQKEIARRKKAQEKFEAERAAMMQPGQQTLPQPDQDIQQVVSENQQQTQNNMGFKRGSMIEEMKMLGMIKKDIADDTSSDVVREQSEQKARDYVKARESEKPHKYDRQYTTNRGKGMMKYITSNDKNHYFVDSSIDALGNWFMPHGVKHKVLTVPHEDFNHFQEKGEFPSASNNLYTSGQVPDSYEHAKMIAENERDIDNDPVSFGYDKQASEPMDIAFQLLKTPVSPEAKRHKLEYDKIVPEDASKNRARHFKGRGTLKSFVLIKR